MPLPEWQFPLPPATCGMPPTNPGVLDGPNVLEPMPLNRLVPSTTPGALTALGNPDARQFANA